MTACTFAGHREVNHAGMDEKIEKAIRELSDVLVCVR